MMLRLIGVGCLALAAVAACQQSPPAVPTAPAGSPVAPAIELGIPRPDATLDLPSGLPSGGLPTPDTVAPKIELGTPGPDPTLGSG